MVVVVVGDRGEIGAGREAEGGASEREKERDEVACVLYYISTVLCLPPPHRFRGGPEIDTTRVSLYRSSSAGESGPWG